MISNADYAWAGQLLGVLQALWPVERPLELVFAVEGHNVWALHEGIADGACNIQPGRIVIFLRRYATNTEYWHDVLIHEYAHAAMADLLEAIANEIPTGAAAYRESAYVQHMEAVTARLAGLLEYAVKTGAVVRKVGA
jgi:hypothetical protein